MHLTTQAPRRHRRYHSPEFKSQVVAACQAPGVSVAAIAQANQLNANLVRRWIKAASGERPAHEVSDVALSPPAPLQPVFVPVEVVDQGTPGEVSSTVAPAIRIELRQGTLELNVDWPTTQAEACAQWLRELLR